MSLRHFFISCELLGKSLKATVSRGQTELAISHMGRSESQSKRKRLDTIKILYERV